MSLQPYQEKGLVSQVKGLKGSKALNWEIFRKTLYCKSKSNKKNQKQNSEYITREHPEELTFSPIVGGPAAPTQRLTNLLDIILKLLCQNVESFIRDD